MAGTQAEDGASTGAWEIRKAAGLSLACGSQEYRHELKAKRDSVRMFESLSPSQGYTSTMFIIMTCTPHFNPES